MQQPPPSPEQPWTAPPSDEVQPVEPTRHNSDSPPQRQLAHPVLYPGLTWILGLMVGVLMLRFVVPFLAEEIQYSITRGEQRAKYDTAGEFLQQTSLNDLSRAYQLVSQRVAPSVVNIRTVRVEDTRTSDNEFRRLFGRVAPQKSRGQGSGVIVDADGYVLTNFHVVHGASEIDVQLNDGRAFTAEVIGVDAPTDMAVLKIEAEDLIPAEWGDSDALEVGSLVWAVGSPFGLDRSITSGILSAKNRHGIGRSPYQDFLQTDAAVNPGNSGGPLVDADGNVIGINTAIIGDSFQGVSFSLASNIARDVFQRLKTKGHVDRGWLGVALEEVTKDQAKEFGLDHPLGVFVPHVIRDDAVPSPAQRAGIQDGDLLLRWGEHPLDSPLTVSRLVAKSQVGSTVPIVVLRDGEELTLQVIVGERPM